MVPAMIATRARTGSSSTPRPSASWPSTWAAASRSDAPAVIARSGEPAWPIRGRDHEPERLRKRNLLAVRAFGHDLVALPALGEAMHDPFAQFLVHEQVERHATLRVLNRLDRPVVEDRVA